VDKEGLARVRARVRHTLRRRRLLEQDKRSTRRRCANLAVKQADEDYERKAAELGPKLIQELEKGIMLRQLDTHWKDTSARSTTCARHSLRGTRSATEAGVQARGVRDFSAMLDRVKHDVVTILSKIQIRRPEDVQAVEPDAPDPRTLRFQHADAPSLVRATAAAAPSGVAARCPRQLRTGPQPARSRSRSTSASSRRSDATSVPLRLGQKYKQCHGRLS